MGASDQTTNLDLPSCLVRHPTSPTVQFCTIDSSRIEIKNEGLKLLPNFLSSTISYG